MIGVAGASTQMGEGRSGSCDSVIGGVWLGGLEGDLPGLDLVLGWWLPTGCQDVLRWGLV